ncbi:MAG: hypothetical protein WA749_03270 [Gelidibacter sp.]
MKIKTICIFTQSPLSQAPRVVKEANVYAEANFEVTVYALWYHKELLEKDQSLLHPKIHYKAGINLLDGHSLKSKKIRLSRKIGRELVKYLHIETIAALGYDYHNYLKLLKNENADLYIGHEEMSMALAEALIKKGHQVAFDFEDWHSRDLLPKDRAYRPLKLLTRLEHYLLEKARYAYTTSHSMATAMANTYNTKVPQVIYNSFSYKERRIIDGIQIDRPNFSKPSLYWFSQVISAGRGLELLFDALKQTKTPLQLHLRGKITVAYHQFLKDNTPNHVQLFVHEVVPYHQLISRIAEHDLGIAFEETTPESRNLTITNKVFHYLQSGIGILATETKGQKEVGNIAPDAICVVDRSAKAIALKIEEIISDKELLERMKKSSWDAGQQEFSFEKEAEKLKQFIHAL